MFDYASISNKVTNDQYIELQQLCLLGNFQQCEGLVRSLIEKQDEIHLLLAEIFWSVGDYDRALREYDICFVSDDKAYKKLPAHVIMRLESCGRSLRWSDINYWYSCGQITCKDEITNTWANSIILNNTGAVCNIANNLVNDLESIKYDLINIKNDLNSLKKNKPINIKKNNVMNYGYLNCDNEMPIASSCNSYLTKNYNKACTNVSITENVNKKTMLSWRFYMNLNRKKSNRTYRKYIKKVKKQNKKISQIPPGWDITTFVEVKDKKSKKPKIKLNLSMEMKSEYSKTMNVNKEYIFNNNISKSEINEAIENFFKNNEEITKKLNNQCRLDTLVDKMKSISGRPVTSTEDEIDNSCLISVQSITSDLLNCNNISFSPMEVNTNVLNSLKPTIKVVDISDVIQDRLIQIFPKCSQKYSLDVCYEPYEPKSILSPPLEYNIDNILLKIENMIEYVDSGYESEVFDSPKYLVGNKYWSGIGDFMLLKNYHSQFLLRHFIIHSYSIAFHNLVLHFVNPQYINTFNDFIIPDVNLAVQTKIYNSQYNLMHNYRNSILKNVLIKIWLMQPQSSGIYSRIYNSNFFLKSTMFNHFAFVNLQFIEKLSK